jgi:GMP synthase-like glutamine amidotransferase
VKPVVICRFAPHEGPGYFATYLSQRGVPWRLATIDEGDVLPRVDAISGLAMMGGAMSVNDDLAWIGPMLDLVRQSVDARVPVIGHCLGGQLLAKALGAVVTRNPVKEIGWGRVDVVNTKIASRWGPCEPFVSYHWHGETFSIPPGAVRIWSSAFCENQAFVLGNSVAMQCHVEMTPEMIAAWCETGAEEIAENLGCSPAVQSAAEMRAEASARIGGLHSVADRVYSRWVEGLTAG